MTSPLTLLGLDADADERAIKRAYAAKLKTVRPDEDPEGFQRLNEAYRAALEWLRSQRTHEDEHAASADDAASADVAAAPGDGAARPAPPVAAHADTASPPAIDADLGSVLAPHDVGEPLPRFLHACLGVAANASRADFEAWLQAQPALWSLSAKAAIGQELVHLLQTESPPVPDRNFEAIVDCFGIDDLHSGYDALLVGRLRQTLHAAWVAAHALGQGAPIPIPVDGNGWPVYGAQRTEEAEAEIARQRREETLRELTDLLHPELAGTRSWPKLLSGLLVPGRTKEIVATIEAFGASAEARFDAGRMRFWRGANDLRRLSRGSAAAVFTRSLAAGLAFAVVLLSIVFSSWGFSRLGEMVFGIFVLGLAIALITTSCWLMLVLARALVEWQAQPDLPPGPARYVHRIAIPLLVALGLAPFATAVSAGFGLPVLAFAAITAWRGLIARHGVPRFLDDRDTGARPVLIRVALGIGLVALCGEIATSDHAIVLIDLALAATATAFWAIDLVRTRRPSPR